MEMMLDEFGKRTQFDEERIFYLWEIRKRRICYKCVIRVIFSDINLG